MYVDKLHNLQSTIGWGYKSEWGTIYSNHIIMGVWADFFSSAKRMFPFSSLNPFPFKPKENKIREDNFHEKQTISLLLSLTASLKEEIYSIFIVLERFYDGKFNMNTQPWLLNHCWLFFLEYFFSFQGGPWSKRLCRPCISCQVISDSEWKMSIRGDLNWKNP